MTHPRQDVGSHANQALLFRFTPLYARQNALTSVDSLAEAVAFALSPKSPSQKARLFLPCGPTLRANFAFFAPGFYDFELFFPLEPSFLDGAKNHKMESKPWRRCISLYTFASESTPPPPAKASLHMLHASSP